MSAPLPNRIRAWRQQRGLSLQQLADAAGTSKGQIDKLEKGDRRLTVDWMVRLAAPLQCDPRELLAMAPPVVTGIDGSGVFGGPAPLPVRGAARGGDAQMMFLTDGPIDEVPRPYYLAHVRDAYAMYVTGTSMVPMYRPRQLVFINPYKPPVPGSGVVIVAPDGAVLIKEFVRLKPGGIVVREYQPAPRDFTIANTAIASLHTVVGATEPS